MEQSRSIARRPRVVRNASLVALGVAIVLGTTYVSARSPRRDGGLLKSTEVEAQARVAKTSPAASAPPSKRKDASSSPAKAATPDPSAPVAPPAKPTPAKPTPPPTPQPPVPQKSADPAVRVKEELQEAQEAFDKKDFATAYRLSGRLATSIKRNEYDRFGTDGSGANAQIFQETLRDATRLAEESGEKISSGKAQPGKALTFYF